MKRFTSLLLAVMMVLSSAVIVVSAEDPVIEITKQPTASDLSVEVNVDSGVEYQWYVTDFSETERSKVNDTNANIVDPASHPDPNVEFSTPSEYDAENDCWYPALVEDSPYLEYFFIEMTKGETITASYSSDITRVFLGNYETQNIFPMVEVEDQTYAATVNETGVFVLVANISEDADESADLSLSAQIDAYVYEPVEGETESKLSSYEPGKRYYCEVTYGETVIKSDFVDVTLEITKQPDATDPSVEVSLPDYVKSYQWQTLADYAEAEIDLTNASPVTAESYLDLAEELPDGIQISTLVNQASYDKVNGWNPAIIRVINNNIKAIIPQYALLYFSASYKEGTTVSIDVKNIEETEIMMMFIISLKTLEQTPFDYDEETGTISAEILESGEYIVVGSSQSTTNLNFTAHGTVAPFEDIEGETEKTLSEMKVGNTYRCVVDLKEGNALYSSFFSADYQIISQPTAIDPTIEVTFAEDATFQWYECVEDITPITDENEKITYTHGTYDSENGYWVPDYGDPYEYEGYQEYSAYYFDIELQEGQAVYVTLTNPDAVSPEDPDFRFYNTDIDEYYYVIPDENGKIEFIAPEDGVYNIYSYCKYPETTNAIFTFTDLTLDTELEGETDKTLKEFELDKSYAVVATYKDGTVLLSDIFLMEYGIIREPSVADPSVEVNFPEDVQSYQWYTYEYQEIVEVTDEIGDSAYLDGESIGEPSYYDEEQKCWIPSLYSMVGDNDEIFEYDIFIVELNKGEAITVFPSEELEDIYAMLYDVEYDPDIGALIDNSWVANEDGSYTFVAPFDESFYFYCDTLYEDCTFTAIINDSYRPIVIEGQTESELTEYGVGSYFCVITYKNGVELITVDVEFTSDDLVKLGDVNADGAINQYDYILVKRHYFGTRLLSDSEIKPADVNGDGEVNQYDYILIKRHYFGTYTIG